MAKKQQKTTKKTIELGEGYVRKGGVNPKPSKPRPVKQPVGYKPAKTQKTTKKS